MKTFHVVDLSWGRLSHAALAFAFSFMTTTAASAAPVDIADFPPFLGGTVSPNVMFIIDDSGSMQFELPDSDYAFSATNYLFPPVSNMYGDGIYDKYLFRFDDDNPRNRYFRSYDNNPFFYNPKKNYEPWYKSDGSQWSNADPKSAYYFPGRTASGSLDLTAKDSHDEWIRYNDGSYQYDTNDREYWPITFYVMKDASGGAFDEDNYVRYQIRGNKAYKKDLEDGDNDEITQFDYGDGIVRSIAEEKQNFANWFSYHRSRTLAARYGIGKAFSGQGELLRVGYGRLNKGSGDVDGEDTSVIVNGVRLFKDSDRANFFTRLYTDKVPNEGTPLRNALYRAGKYYERSDDAGPWGAAPGTDNNADHLECRQSFTILMTDGYWSGDSPDVGNVDGSDGETIGSYQYEPVVPFKDDRSDTLADVAMYFWNRDLRDDLSNEVPVSKIDPAFWQHMVTYGVGLGVTGSIDPNAAFDALENGTSIDWPNPKDAESAKVDDLLHASVNGRGGFFNASNPDTFALQLGSLLTNLLNRVEESSTSAAASSAVLREDALSFSAGFRSNDWSGALQAAEIESGGARGSLIWDAEYALEAKGADARNLYTYAGDAGVTLDTLSSLSTEQQTALNTATDGSSDGLGQDRIDWLRGDDDANAAFRSRLYKAKQTDPGRLRLLGDIIGSDPQYAGKTNFGHRRLPGAEGAAYALFLSGSSYQNRRDVIYVGANDGFLHAFDARTGNELFAYMPGELLEPESGSSYAQINELMEPKYDHRYFVDGTPTVGDAYIGGEWRTVLIGTMGAGGRTVFALDVTDPENFDASDVLWEFTDPDLGYGVESPQIARLPSGKWAAIFGNGVNNNSNQSALYAVDIADGSLISKVATGAGTAATPNGMAPPTVLLDQATGIAKSAYAGDLQGNVWRFNLSSFNSTKLFTASISGARQPITSAPSLALKPDGGPNDLVIVFGTGSYFRVTDSGNNQIQSLYGIYDNGSASAVTRGNLLEQDITTQQQVNYEVVNADGSTTNEPAEIRVISNNSPSTSNKGWYIDLDRDSGERVISSPSFPSGYPVKRVRFSTLIPDNNDCGGGRDGYLMDIDLVNGGQTDDAVFDLNRDGDFTVADAAGGSVVNGIKGVTSGEELRVVLDNKTDLFVDSIIVDLPDDYEPPVEDPPTGGEDDGDNDEDDDDDDGGNPCVGPLCGSAEGYNFGRQNWEELR